MPRLPLLLLILALSLNLLLLEVEYPSHFPSSVSIEVSSKNGHAATVDDSAFYTNLQARALTIHTKNLADTTVRNQSAVELRTLLQTIRTLRNQIGQIQAQARAAREAQGVYEPETDVVHAMRDVPRDLVQRYDEALTLRNAYLGTAIEQAYQPTVAHYLISYFDNPNTPLELKELILSRFPDSIGFLSSQERDWSTVKTWLAQKVRDAGNPLRRETTHAFLSAFRPLKTSADLALVRDTIFPDPAFDQNLKLKALTSISPIASLENFNFLAAKLRDSNPAIKRTALQTIQQYDLERNDYFFSGFRDQIQALVRTGLYQSSPQKGLLKLVSAPVSTLPLSRPLAGLSPQNFLAQVGSGGAQCDAQNHSGFRLAIDPEQNSTSLGWAIYLPVGPNPGTESEAVQGTYGLIDFRLGNELSHQTQYNATFRITSSNYLGTSGNSGGQGGVAVDAAGAPRKDACLTWFVPGIVESPDQSCWVPTSGLGRKTQWVSDPHHPQAPTQYTPWPPGAGDPAPLRAGDCPQAAEFKAPVDHSTNCPLGLAIYDGAAEVTATTELLPVDRNIEQFFDLRAPYALQYPVDKDGDHLADFFESNTIIKTSGSYQPLDECRAQTVLGIPDALFDQDAGFREFVDSAEFNIQPVGDLLSIWEEMRGFVLEYPFAPTVVDPITGAHVRLTSTMYLVPGEQSFRNDPRADPHGADCFGGYCSTWPGVKQLFVRSDLDVNKHYSYFGVQRLERMLGTQPVYVDLLDPAQRDVCREGYCDIGRTVNFNNFPYIQQGLAIKKVPSVRTRWISPSDVIYDPTDPPRFLAITIARRGFASTLLDSFPLEGTSLPIVFVTQNILDALTNLSAAITNFNHVSYLQFDLLHELSHKLAYQREFGHEPLVQMAYRETLTFQTIADLIVWANDPAHQTRETSFYWMRVGPLDPAPSPERYRYFKAFWSPLEIIRVPLDSIEYPPSRLERSSKVVGLTNPLSPSPRFYIVPEAARNNDDERALVLFLLEYNDIQTTDALDSFDLFDTSAEVPRSGRGASYRNYFSGALEPERGRQLPAAYGSIDLNRGLYRPGPVDSNH